MTADSTWIKREVDNTLVDTGERRGRQDIEGIGGVGKLVGSQTAGTMRMALRRDLLVEWNQRTVAGVARDVFWEALVLRMERFLARSVVKDMFSLHIETMRLEQVIIKMPLLTIMAWLSASTAISLLLRC